MLEKLTRNAHLKLLMRRGCMFALPLLLFAADAQAIKVLTPDGPKDGYECHDKSHTIFSITPCKDLGMEEVTYEDNQPSINAGVPNQPATNQNAADSGQTTGKAQAVDPSAPDANKAVETNITVPPREKLNNFQKLGRAILAIAVIFITLKIMKQVTVMLETGRTGMFSCFLAGIIAQFFAVLVMELTFMLGLGKLPLLSVFVSALVFMLLFRTNYVRGLLIALMSYGIFISLLSMFSMKMIGHPLLMS